MPLGRLPALPPRGLPTDAGVHRYRASAEHRPKRHVEALGWRERRARLDELALERLAPLPVLRRAVDRAGLRFPVAPAGLRLLVAPAGPLEVARAGRLEVGRSGLRLLVARAGLRLLAARAGLRCAVAPVAGRFARVAAAFLPCRRRPAALA